MIASWTSRPPRFSDSADLHRQNTFDSIWYNSGFRLDGEHSSRPPGNFLSRPALMSFLSVAVLSAALSPMMMPPWPLALRRQSSEYSF